MAKQDNTLLLGADPTTGGDGPNSHAHNSVHQKRTVDGEKQMINQSIANDFDMKNQNFDFSSIPCFRIATFGCSVGPNIFISLQSIIEAVESKYQLSSCESPEFQVIFNDYIDDFNTLFRSLPTSREYLVAGVPGSSHGRLFPNSTLHFVYSSSALHWLSKVPEEVMDKSSPAWNKGTIYCTGTSKHVNDAYLGQFERDVESFLNARAQELVMGGLMCLVISGIPNGAKFSESALGKVYDLLGFCLEDMAARGLISGEKLDSFNLPLYYPTSGKFLEVIKKNKHLSMVRFAILKHPLEYFVPSDQMIAGGLRAAIEGVIKNHFGDQIDIDELFSLYLKKLPESRPSIVDDNNRRNMDICIFLNHNGV
ncbi:SAM dependent carboxyl methyltransferase [Dillenia turbinata]|uniref:SAM dependent carboxyl methyltransferase n=1 Tax=Dillenia turbinata TaxID=194707 RepID=A0AAN8Z7L6_9MAGN